MRGLLRWTTFVLAFAWLGAGNAAAQRLYKWTDKDGKVHFSNVSPGGEGATDESSGVTGIEAQGTQSSSSESSRAEQPSSAAPHEQAAAEDSSGGISEEAFSLQVSTTRSRLKRELAAAKEQSQQADDRLAALKQELNQPTRVDLQMLQKAYGPNQQVGSEEDALRKQKKDADARVEEIRKEYAELREQAVKRYGHQPSWWLPLD